MSENPFQTAIKTAKNIGKKMSALHSLKWTALAWFTLKDEIKSNGHDELKQIYENNENTNNRLGTYVTLLESLKDTVGEDRVSSNEDSERIKEANKMKLIGPIKSLNDNINNPKDLDRQEMYNKDLGTLVKVGKDILNKVENKYGDKFKERFREEIKDIQKINRDYIKKGKIKEANKVLETIYESLDSPDDYLFGDISGTEEDNISDLLGRVKNISQKTGHNPDEIEKEAENILKEYSALNKIDERKVIYEELPKALVHILTEGATLGEIVEGKKEKYDVWQAERELAEELNIELNRTTFEDVLERYKLNIASETDEKQIDRYTEIVNKDKNKTAFMGKNPASIAAAIIKKTTNSLDEEIGTEKLSQKYNISEKSIEDRLEELNELEDDTTRTANTYHN